MSDPAAPRTGLSHRRAEGTALRMAFLGARAWLDASTPPASAPGVRARTFEIGPGANLEQSLASLRAYRPHVSVVFDPCVLTESAARRLPGATLGVLTADPEDGEHVLGAMAALDRLVSFDPALTGKRFGQDTVWRAIPAPVSDAFFAEVRPARQIPRAMSVGRSTGHRERMLLPAKHRCDLLQVIHGLSGAELGELFGDYDVGVHISAESGGGFGWQAGAHLAAGQLLISDKLSPSHGLEANIDYLQVASPEELTWVLERLARFPGMHDGIRVRGRMKAESYRASRLFARVAYDLLADIFAFGRGRGAGGPLAV